MSVHFKRNDTSRMKREFHVRFCERLEGETPSCLLSVIASEEVNSYDIFANKKDHCLKILLQPD